MKHRDIFLAIFLLASAQLSMAQYIWIDDKGVKQLSDRPPPPSVPDKRILKAPGKPLFNPYAPTEPEAAAPPSPKPAPTLAERNDDYNKRQSDAAETAQRAADEAKRKAEQAARCDSARKNQQALDQGVRLSSFDKNGERSFMDDAQRANLQKNTRLVLAECK
jgi:type IV secretory pathway VirB10-like protein